jgi:hypothetical protein
MAILKFILFIFLVMFAMAAIRIALSIFRFLRMVRKVRKASPDQSGTPRPDRKESNHEPKTSRDGKTITLGKDDYHVD